MQKPTTFRPWQPEQTTLLPPSPREWPGLLQSLNSGLVAVVSSPSLQRLDVVHDRLHARSDRLKPL